MVDVAAKGRVYLDTNVFIRAFESSDEEAAPIKAMLSALRQKAMRAVTSELTLAELLAPAQTGPAFVTKQRFYLDLIIWAGFIDLQPVTRSILLETPYLRQWAARKSLPDAIHIVTAARTGCLLFMSDDRQLKTPNTMQLVLPDSAGVATILAALDA